MKTVWLAAFTPPTDSLTAFNEISPTQSPELVEAAAQKAQIPSTKPPPMFRINARGQGNLNRNFLFIEKGKVSLLRCGKVRPAARDRHPHLLAVVGGYLKQCALCRIDHVLPAQLQPKSRVVASFQTRQLIAGGERN